MNPEIILETLEKIFFGLLDLLYPVKKTTKREELEDEAEEVGLGKIKIGKGKAVYYERLIAAKKRDPDLVLPGQALEF